MGELIAACEADAELTADPATKADIREFRRDYDLATKLPVELVRELTEVGSRAQNIWRKAREQSDFSVFQPILERLVGLVRQKAECYGTPEGGELYDALLNEYEPGARAADIESIFTPLAERLSALVANLADNGTPPDTSCLDLTIDASRQHAFGLFILDAIGFDLNAGRLDTTPHPFCEGLAPGDTRLTTRYRDERFTDALYGTMHEAGHGLYEQGLDPKHSGPPMGDAVSLGIHESQSRLWENLVGRSDAFWDYHYGDLQAMFPEPLRGVSRDAFYRAINTVAPSFIRVEADELTYNLHIILRFEIERGIFTGSLGVEDIPAAWNESCQRLLGITPPDDRQGCLQDIHWSMGIFGYFPTYALGNLYAAQFFEQAATNIPDLADRIRANDHKPLLSWLRTNIHQHGQPYRAAELVEKVTGKPLSIKPFMDYVTGKFSAVYGL